MTHGIQKYIERLYDYENKKEGSDKYGLLTKCEVKMAGYWPSSFLMCLWTPGRRRSRGE